MKAIPRAVCASAVGHLFTLSCVNLRAHTQTHTHVHMHAISITDCIVFIVARHLTERPVPVLKMFVTLKKHTNSEDIVVIPIRQADFKTFPLQIFTVYRLLRVASHVYWLRREPVCRSHVPRLRQLSMHISAC